MAVCQAGRNWLTIQSDACFETSEGIFRSCYCPVSSCVEVSALKHECRLTDGVYVLVGLLFGLFWLLVFLYMWVNPRWSEHFWDRRARGAKGESSLPSRIYRTLFPEDFPQSTSRPVSYGTID